MDKRLIRNAAILAVLAATTVWSGCLQMNWRQALVYPVSYTAMEYFLDSDAGFDLWEGGATVNNP